MDDFKGTTKLLSSAGFDAVSAALQADACALWSLITVETRGFGFLPSRRPKILFERHIFHARTGGRFDAQAPDLSAPTAGGYSGGEQEYDRLQRAIALDRKAALESASWGLGQIMGFNATALGYADAETMITQFCDSEDAQLDGVRRFIANDRALHAALQSQDWNTVARQYNGPSYAKNEYNFKLDHYFSTYKANGTPAIDVRAAQVRLTYLGYDAGGIDGLWGARTKAALTAFQGKQGIAASGTLDSATITALQQAVGF
jgi:hypothetical protein